MQQTSDSAGGVEGPCLAFDVWHATAAPAHRLSLGGLAPAVEDGRSDAVDLAIVAPTRAELGRRWLEQSIAVAAGGLAEDGLVWIIVPRGWRGRAERALRRSGLTLLETVATIPPWPRTTHFVPLLPAAVRDAGRRQLGWSRTRARLVAALLGVPLLRRLLRRVARSCALVAGREAAPVLRWLGELDDHGVGTATVRAGPRRDAPVLAVLRFRDGLQGPDLAAKVALNDDAQMRLRRERDALDRVAPGASLAGAEIPAALPAGAPWVLASPMLVGRSAAAVLADDPDRLEQLAAAVVRWLGVWNAGTARRGQATHTTIEELLIAPAEGLAAIGAVGAEYVGELAALARRLDGRPLVTVSAHNDLTMSNVLDTGRGIAVLDWEAATTEGMPLHDLWYALADALSRARRVSHAAAVEALVHGTSGAPSALVAAPGELAAALSLEPDQAQLGFHACWLSHAADELDRGIADGPFAAVVSAVAAKRLLSTRPAATESR